MRMKLKPEIVDTILDSAESLFNKQGYCPVSLELIAKDATVSKRTLYKYFGDKDGLVNKVLLRRDAYFKTSLSDVVAVFTEKKDKINAIISWHIRWFNSDDFQGCMFFRAKTEYANKNENICNIAREHKQWIQNLICQCLGGTKACEKIACLIMLILEGMISHASVFGVKGDNFAFEKTYILGLINNIDYDVDPRQQD